jgi:glutamate-1-semialdehyde 2,1-aminomutase
MKQTSLSRTERALKVIPGGMNSSVRNYPPAFEVSRADGPYFWDVHGKRYLDFFGSAGPMVLGFNNKNLNRKVSEAVEKYDALSVGISEPEYLAAEKIHKYIKGAENVLFCNGGSDATFHAIRVSRAFTGREKIIKMQGSFHGWHDYVLMNVNTAIENVYKQDLESAGMLKGVADQTLHARVNDLEHLEKIINENKGKIAALLIDPCGTSFGYMQVDPEYMRGARKLCDQEGIVLIFDEVVTGFRVGLGGAGWLFDVTPDLITIGKAVANGYPIAAVCGKKEIMQCFNTNDQGIVAYLDNNYAHPVLCTAVLATIEELEKPGVYEHMEEIGDMFCSGMEEIANRLDIPFSTQHKGSLIGLYFGPGPYTNHEEVLKTVDSELSIAFRKGMVDRGFFLPPGATRRVVLSYAHSKTDIENTLQAAEDTLRELKGKN